MALLQNSFEKARVGCRGDHEAAGHVLRQPPGQFAQTRRLAAHQRLVRTPAGRQRNGDRIRAHSPPLQRENLMDLLLQPVVHVVEPLESPAGKDVQSLRLQQRRIQEAPGAGPHGRIAGHQEAEVELDVGQ